MFALPLSYTFSLLFFLCEGPFVFTEFGPAGSWETGSVTSWGQPIEATPTVKVFFFFSPLLYYLTVCLFPLFSFCFWSRRKTFYKLGFPAPVTLDALVPLRSFSILCIARAVPLGSICLFIPLLTASLDQSSRCLTRCV